MEKETRTMSKDLGDTEGKTESPEQHLVGVLKKSLERRGRVTFKEVMPSFPELKQAKSPSEQAHWTPGTSMVQKP